jgi:hypothetical protein
MKRRFGLIALCLVIVAGATSARADSLPIIEGRASLLEFCPQAWCGTALFAGVFQGRVGFNPRAFGFIAVAANHGPLPTPGGPPAPLAGAWQLQVGLRQFRGSVVGSLEANPDNTFDVNGVMTILQGGSGELFFEGLLNHNVFPPTLIGDIMQFPK